VLADFKYLESITENLIYETYRDAILCDHTRTFADFKQEHRDTYLRLKMRGMRPFNFIPPVFIPQNFVANMKEEKKSSEAIVTQPLSLNSLNSMISKMD
jgi:septin family protein